jgi:hypothetical protein
MLVPQQCYEMMFRFSILLLQSFAFVGRPLNHCSCYPLIRSGTCLCSIFNHSYENEDEARKDPNWEFVKEMPGCEIISPSLSVCTSSRSTVKMWKEEKQISARTQEDRSDEVERISNEKRTRKRTKMEIKTRQSNEKEIQKIMKLRDLMEVKHWNIEAILICSLPGVIGNVFTI